MSVEITLMLLLMAVDLFYVKGIIITGEIMLGFLIFFLVVIAFNGFFIVQQQSCAIIERLGKFHRIAHSG
ncbi:MAG: hypothetical protein J5821_00370, partial [Alphaproteobacteria bacterium]|nr:hypothetical protein [Alphaproteobacteria bacterium]